LSLAWGPWDQGAGMTGDLAEEDLGGASAGVLPLVVERVWRCSTRALVC